MVSFGFLSVPEHVSDGISRERTVVRASKGDDWGITLHRNPIDYVYNRDSRETSTIFRVGV